MPALKKGDTLNVGETKSVQAYIAYSKWIEIDGNYGSEGSCIESTELPKRNLIFNDLSIKINYIQAD